MNFVVCFLFVFVTASLHSTKAATDQCSQTLKCSHFGEIVHRLFVFFHEKAFHKTCLLEVISDVLEGRTPHYNCPQLLPLSSLSQLQCPYGLRNWHHQVHVSIPIQINSFIPIERCPLTDFWKFWKKKDIRTNMQNSITDFTVIKNKTNNSPSKFCKIILNSLINVKHILDPEHNLWKNLTKIYEETINGLTPF